MIGYAIIAAVVAQRLAELWYAQKNTRALLARGAVEIGRAHYPLFVVLHLAWLVAVVLGVRRAIQVNWFAVAGYAALQGLRLWTIVSLGPYWTTRILSLPSVPLVRRGPYRFVRHPNYLIVMGEIALLPLAFRELWIAVIFSALNAALLAWRVRDEERALGTRRRLQGTLG